MLNKTTSFILISTIFTTIYIINYVYLRYFKQSSDGNKVDIILLIGMIIGDS